MRHGGRAAVTSGRGEPPRSGDVIRAAVIGAGHIGRQHMAALRAVPQAELVGICDLSPAVAEATAERIGDVAWFTDAQRMLAEVEADVVHVTTPVTSHVPLAHHALDAGAHVVLEKPATIHYTDLVDLIDRAERQGRVIVEDHNYVFNTATQRILEGIDRGRLGDVVHVDVEIALDILAPGNPFVDSSWAHPALSLPGGAIHDFLTHLASLAYVFVGAHEVSHTSWRKLGEGHPLPSDELRALVVGERATATLGFSSHAQPDRFRLCVESTRGRAETNLFEVGLFEARAGIGPNALTAVYNGIAESRAAAQAAIGGLARKLSGGPGAYEGLWALIARTYLALDAGAEVPVSHRQILEVNRLVRDLAAESRVP